MEDQVYRDKGTLKAVMRQYAIDHRFQWKTNISSEISDLKGTYNGTFLSASSLDGAVFYAMSKAYRHSEFDDLMKKVEHIDIRVKNYLELAGYEKWARVYATVDRGSVMTSNIVECINACLVDARELPVYDFLEEVRQMFGRWNFTNHTSTSNTFTTLCGKLKKYSLKMKNDHGNK
ncbi:hypothetical protein KY289_025042 [Solanum tuberosum]|nr:hypothetical protein KY289_025042 [Solanum tuberosum]